MHSYRLQDQKCMQLLKLFQSWLVECISGNPALDKMDKMLQEADITPANLTA